MMDEIENKQLLMRVLQEHYKDRYSIVEQALAEIDTYSKNANKNAYKQTLNKLYSLMNGDLPPKILLYFLTMVPLPNIDDESKPDNVFAMMRKTHDSLPKNIRPILLSYLKETSAPNNSQVEKDVSIDTEFKHDQMINPQDDEPPSENSYKLVDICARHIFANMEGLKKMYQEKNASVWKLIYSCENDETILRQCYTTVEYLNKQRKLLRMIENHEISLDVFEEEYGNSEVFLKQSHLLKVLEFNSSEHDSDLLADAIARFADRC